MILSLDLQRRRELNKVVFTLEPLLFQSGHLQIAMRMRLYVINERRERNGRSSLSAQLGLELPGRHTSGIWLWGHFQRGLIEERWPILNVGSSILWAGRLDCIKRGKKRKPGEYQNSLLLSDCGYNVTSSLIFWTPDCHVFSCRDGVPFKLWVNMNPSCLMLLPAVLSRQWETETSTDREIREERSWSAAPCGKFDRTRPGTSSDGVTP